MWAGRAATQNGSSQRRRDKEGSVNPNLVALFASVLLGVAVFPWTATLQRSGLSGFFVSTGAIYMFTGLLVYTWSTQQTDPNSPSLGDVGLAILTGCIYAAALICCSYAYSQPQASVAVIAAITGAFPAWTALVMFARGQRYSWREWLFLCMVVGGVIGLSLNSKQPNQS